MKCVNILEDLHNFVSQCFQNEQRALQNHAWVKGAFEMQEISMDSNKNKKFIDVVSYSTLQLTLKKYHLLSVRVVSKNCPNDLKKLLKDFPLFSNYISVWGWIFLTYFNQNNIFQQTWVQEQVWESRH